jgi:hypothetical protein
VSGDKDEAGFNASFNKDFKWLAVPFAELKARMPDIQKMVKLQHWPMPAVLNAKTLEVLDPNAY